MKPALLWLSILASMHALSSCGGGGSGGTKALTPTLTISSANAARTAEVTVIATNISDSASVSDEALEQANAVALSAETAKRAAQRMQARALPQAQVSDTVACDTPSSGSAGSFILTINDADNNLDLSVNDTIEARFTNCLFAPEGVTTNGTLSLRVTSVSGTSLGLAAEFTNLATDVSGSGDITLNGSMNFTANTLTPTSTRVTITSGTLTTQHGGDTVTVSAPNLTITTDDLTGRYVIFGGASVTSLALGGTIVFDIPSSTPLTGRADANPDSGAINITGARSSMLVTVLGGNNVRLDIDTTGDQIVDESRTVTWDEILV
jgi:hypothetical protein